jgi:hypothetical protein
MEKSDDARNHNQDKRVKYYNEPSDYVVTIHYASPIRVDTTPIPKPISERSPFRLLRFNRHFCDSRRNKPCFGVSPEPTLNREGCELLVEHNPNPNSLNTTCRTTKPVCRR